MARRRAGTKAGAVPPGPPVLERRGAAPAFHPLTADRWNDLVRLFGPRGACGGCWCMVWRLTPSDWDAGKKDGGRGNRRRLRQLVARGEVPGVVGYIGREPVAWCAIAPRERYPRLAASRVLAPVDEKPVWSISCLFVAKSHRGRGLAARAIDAAVRLAARRGAKIVEAYPIVATMEKTPDTFVWLGTPSAYANVGFRVVARRSRTRPVMRRTLRRSPLRPSR